MRDWLVSAALALAALFLFWLLLFPKPNAARDLDGRPLSDEASGAGLVAATRWLRSSQVPVVAWRKRFDGLAAASPAPSGNLLVTFLPHAMPLRADELEALDRWVRRGNTLLVMAALADTPRWSAARFPFGFESELQRLTRLTFSVVNPPKNDEERTREAVESALAPPDVKIVPVQTPAGPHPLFAAVPALKAHSDLPASRWNAAPMDVTPVFAIARRADNDDAAVWLKAFGAGSVIVSAFASPLSNDGLADPGNADWFANVAAFALRPGGTVFLDDAHQGLTEIYDPVAFFRDPRLHHTLWWIVVVWFLFVLGSRHLHAAQDARVPVDDAAMLRVTGDFYANAVAPVNAGQRLFQHFFNALRRRQGLAEDGSPLWDWLAGDARVRPVEVAELRGLHAALERGRPVDLERLQSLLSRMSGHLA